jgi:glycosyltransferase involved in cell wall biosynthesis
VEFFEGLRVRLAASGIALQLYVGDPVGAERLKRDSAQISWAIPIRSRVIRFGWRTLLWQPVLRQVHTADLVIVEQASRLLVNYLLLAGAKIGGPKVAFWGHGKNLQNDHSRVGEWVKRRVSRFPDWWFGYTEGTAEIVRALGFPPDRITVTNNSIDTQSLTTALRELTDDDVERCRLELGVDGGQVGLFVGSLYPEKQILFLIEACKAVRNKVPDFELVVVGDGPERSSIEAATRKLDWVHLIGRKTAEECVPYVAMSQLLLVPAAVGLVALDSIALETPIVATRGGCGPEIEYLVNGVNACLLAEGTSSANYARAVVDLLLDDERREALVAGCRDAQGSVTVEAMVDRFAAGVEAAMSAS